MDWVCNITFENDIVLDDWRSAEIVPMFKDKGERTECCNYRGISLLSVDGKIYTGILVDRVHKVTEDLIDYVQGGFRVGRRCIDQIFIQKEKCEKARDKKCGVYNGCWFYGLGKEI